MKIFAPEGDEAGAPPFHVATTGGTFQAMHLGHRQYLELALRLADTVHISLTSDHYASTFKDYQVMPFDIRCKEIKSFLTSIGASDRIRIHELNSLDQLKEFMLTTVLDVALVEPQYLELFQSFNRLRSDLKMDEYCIVLKPRTKVDGLDISSTALHASPARSERKTATVPVSKSTSSSAAR
jgi:cytidyltransferase-like protein